ARALGDDAARADEARDRAGGDRGGRLSARSDLIGENAVTLGWKAATVFVLMLLAGVLTLLARRRNYEGVRRHYPTRRTPVAVRVVPKRTQRRRTAPKKHMGSACSAARARR